ncbi:MAG: ABC transporter substrate-binding protein [Candidatus Bathyarchaeota archaeon]
MERKKSFQIFILIATFLATLAINPLTFSQPVQYGPKLEHKRIEVINGPDAQLISMFVEETDVWKGVWRPSDVEALADAGFTITETPGFHICVVSFNMRRWYFGPQEGSSPGQALRHAIAHLIDKAQMISYLKAYTASELDTVVPDAMRYWQNLNVDPHPYDPDMAALILLDAGWWWDGFQWRAPDGTPLPTLDFLSPIALYDPQKWQIVATIVDAMQALTLPGDIPAPLPVVHVTAPARVLHSTVFDSHNYDIAILNVDTGKHPDYLYDYFHSSQDFPWGHNSAGLTNPVLDIELDTIMFSLNHEDKMTACHNAQFELIGDPIHVADTFTDGLLPWVPIYAKVFFDIFNPNLRDMVMSPGFGAADNWWTEQNVYWEPGLERPSDLVAGGEMAVWILEEEPFSFNPLFPENPYGWRILSEIYDPNLMQNPFTHKLKPWNAYGWTIEPWIVPDGPREGEEGMKMTFYENDTHPVHWHDCHEFDAFDKKFAWEYLTANQIPQYWHIFKWFHHAEVSDVPINRTVSAYMTTTSQWFIFWLSETGKMIPEHIWGCCHEREGRALPACDWWPQSAAWNAQLDKIWAAGGTAGIKPDTDADAFVESGLCGCPGTMLIGTKTTCNHGCGCVLDDPLTAPNEILSYDPTLFAWGTPAYPLLTELVGTGCWVFQQYNPILLYADLLAFDMRTHESVMPECHYWKTTDEIQYQLAEMFHEIGDVNWDGIIDALDQLLIGLAYGSKIGDPTFDPEADLNGDGIVNCVDLSIHSYYFGSFGFHIIPLPPWFDVAINGVTISRTVVGTGYDTTIQVVVENRYDPLTADISVYYDSNLLETQTVAFDSGQIKTPTFTWNTAGVPKNTYTITASIPIFPCGVDNNDNTYIDGTVLVTIPGDVNGDRIVDIFDIGYISAHWYPGPPIGPLGYTANADINNDGAVDIFDIGITSAHWGQSW